MPPSIICQALSAMLAGILSDDTSDLSTRQCFLKLIRVCHTDRCGNMDYHVCYAALVCTAMIKRCMLASNGEDLMNIYAMPRMLITPFKPNNARTAPPSHFELCAAKMAQSQRMTEGNPFKDRWERVNAV